MKGGLCRPPFFVMKRNTAVHLFVFFFRKNRKGYFLEKLDLSTPQIGQVQL